MLQSGGARAKLTSRFGDVVNATSERAVASWSVWPEVGMEREWRADYFPSRMDTFGVDVGVEREP
jgi:hypothetical protein